MSDECVSKFASLVRSSLDAYDSITPPARVISAEVQNDQERHVNKRGILYKWLACRPTDSRDLFLPHPNPLVKYCHLACHR